MPDKLSSNDYLVKVNVDLEVFRHVASISGLFFGLSLFLMKVSVSLVGTHDHFCWFLKYIKFLVETRQSGLPELRPDHEQSEMQCILDPFEKRIGKKKQTQN